MTGQPKPLILVVDDDIFQHKIVEMILGRDGYQLAFASGGEEALRFVEQTHADLILMDVQMPELSGLETTRRLKSQPHLAHMPILMISGASDDKVVAQCLQSGAADFVLKPFDRVILPAKVALLLGLAANAHQQATGEEKNGTKA